jgi:hypothetical protein
MPSKAGVKFLPADTFHQGVRSQSKLFNNFTLIECIWKKIQRHLHRGSPAVSINIYWIRKQCDLHPSPITIITTELGFFSQPWC